MNALTFKLLTYLAAILIGAAAWHWTPLVGPHARIVHLKSDLDLSHRETKAWSDAYKLSEKNRDAERNAAASAMQNAESECGARVAAARKSAHAIQEIVNEPVKHDPSGCPLRGIVAADRLRNALQP